MPFANLNDIELYYESHGTGPALVFAHGAGGNHLSWWQQVPAFQERFRCVTFDHRAFGLSRDVAGAGRVQFAADVIALVDRLQIRRFFVIAQSTGGRTAAGLIRRAPERLRGVVFAGSTGGSVDDDVRALQRKHTHSLPEESRTLMARSLWPGFVECNPQLAFLYREINRLNPKATGGFPGAAARISRNVFERPRPKRRPGAVPCRRARRDHAAPDRRARRSAGDRCAISRDSSSRPFRVLRKTAGVQ
ncbi:MAG TPA: alpha/beta hydrolase [Dehalococcoidia bacterium]